jgi:indolepyruvate ferredoxin oxidoreductase
MAYEGGAALRRVALDDRFDLNETHVFCSGTQALIRLCLMQHERDKLSGLNTAGYVSGYRGSPVGGLDMQFMRAKKYLTARNIIFQSGLNEDLAATAIWGTQQAELIGEGKYDGVFSMWYGKGPGVDRCGDVFRHANFAGTSRHGGVLALMGDDHTAESSSIAHQTEFHFIDLMIPILSPAGVQEILDFGLHGWAMSRFSGNWIAFKALKDTIESTGSIDASLDRIKIVIPDDFKMPEGGLNIRASDNMFTIGVQEERLHTVRREAVLAYIRANNLDRTITSGGNRARTGIITVGKSYLDVRQALDALGIDEIKANELGLRLLKVASPWPLVPQTITEFAQGLEKIIVVEEKRPLIETQLREILYGRSGLPIIGKHDEKGAWLFHIKGALDPNIIALAIGERVNAYAKSPELARRLDSIRAAEARRAELTDFAVRIPHFCSGCPHNTSTKVPEGMRAYAGIGCHIMVTWMDRNTGPFTHMGAEGANWIGESLFSKREHVFQNLGDGTYMHSGILAIRAAIVAGVNITYKILFNDAVAMTGGQANDGNLNPAMIARQLRAEGVERIAVVSDEPDKYPADAGFPANVTFNHRDDLEFVQRELATIKGVTALIYDQTCAAEKRRRRKKGTFPDPDKRILINELVCEGCGDCSVQSNCISVVPVNTEFGRKRTIDQSGCNKDYSCVKGFCPSFVSVHGAKIRKVEAASDLGDWGVLPTPQLPELDGSYGILVTGIGGTGVVTIGQILGMAAHIEGKGTGLIDMAGLAQKGGAVYVHVRIAKTPGKIQAIRVEAGGARMIIGGDLLVTGSSKVISAIEAGKTKVVVNTEEIVTGEFTRDADFSLPTERLKKRIRTETKDQGRFVPATQIATALFGNSIAANMFLLGYAWQMGGIPLSEEALLEAIRINGEAIEMNQHAFEWGRRAAADPVRLEQILEERRPKTEAQNISQTYEEIVARRVAFLTGYQNEAYAAHYKHLVDRIALAESARAANRSGLKEAVARYLFKLMAYKDEYEVARLYHTDNFKTQLKNQFSSYSKLEFHLAPPLFARKDPATGLPRKVTLGPWILSVFGVLAKFKFLRGTKFDPFGYTKERKMERNLIAEYEAWLEEVASTLTASNHALAVAISSLPEKIRGYGHVKERHFKAAAQERDNLLAQYRSSPQGHALAAE